MKLWPWVIAALLLTQSPLRAAGIECKRATSKAEATICGSPSLLTMDATLNQYYGSVRAAAHGPLRPALVAGQRRWLSARNRECADSECLATRMRERIAVLGALASRVSDANPTLLDLTSVWLVGNWRTGSPTPVDLQSASDLPSAGDILTFNAGEICSAGKCAPFGLEPQTLAKGPGRETWPKALGVSPDTPFYLAYIDGKAAYGLVPTQDGTLLAVTPGCAPVGTPCGIIRQIWRAEGPQAKLIRQSAAP